VTAPLRFRAHSCSRAPISVVRCRAMLFRPNPPRLITVVVALALGVLGFIVAWPVDQALPYLEPVDRFIGQWGLELNREMGFLGLFACPSLLAIGSLVPGI
jgi:hypothetical protein